MAEAVRIGNVSGFYGDRVSAAREVVESGPVDVLTGDWLAELTMYVLARRRLKHGPGNGYAATFLDQLEQVLAPCLDRGIRIVSNAGGLDPRGLALAVQELALQRGLRPRVAYVDGDDLMPLLSELSAAGERFPNLATGQVLASSAVPPLTANAYLGAFGIKAALVAGADVVVTGRVTDASVVVGPAAWRFGWGPEDLDELAGATVAGHLLESGTPASGGAYSFFREVPGVEHVGFPLAEVAQDGSAVITKRVGTGGLVDVGTLTGQLLYQVEGPLLPGPDVVTRLDTIRLDPAGVDRVRVSGAKGEAPPDRVKVAVIVPGGFRTEVSFVLTGPDLEAKAELVERQLFAAVDGGRDAFDEVVVQLLPHGDQGLDGDPVDHWHAQAQLRVVVRSRDPNVVGRAFTARAVELTLSSAPGLFLPGPPPEPTAFGVFWPTTVGHELVPHRMTLLEPLTGSESVTDIPWSRGRSPLVSSAADPAPGDAGDWGPTVRGPLGRVVGARSGTRGGDAMIGLWVRPELPDADAAFRWLCEALTAERLPALMPEAHGWLVERFTFANLRAVNLVVRGMLGHGVGENTALDPQGLGLGEYLRARHVDLPVLLLGRGEPG
jgi:Acyclic terpene utilisation family protein AtuA